PAHLDSWHQGAVDALGVRRPVKVGVKPDACRTLVPSEFQPMSGHAHHFLSRLDRVSTAHVDLALSLYRDEALVRAVVADARADSHDRVAISLCDQKRGP